MEASNPQAYPPVLLKGAPLLLIQVEDMKVPGVIISYLGTHGKSPEMIKCKTVQNYTLSGLDYGSQRRVAVTLRTKEGLPFSFSSSFFSFLLFLFLFFFCLKRGLHRGDGL